MPVAVALWGIAALLATSALAVALQGRLVASRLVYLVCLVVSAILLGVGCVALLGAGPPSTIGLPLGLPWIGAHFRIDALSAVFLVVVNLGAAGASLFGIGYGEHESSPGRVLPFYPAFLGAMNLVVLADDAFTFLVSWESMSLTSWALVMAHHHEEENRRAGYIYIVMASFGTLALLLAFGLLAGGGGGYAFAQMREVAPAFPALVLMLALLGAGSKAGLVPLHVWLPLAHPAAPSHVSALMSGVMTKVAVYGFIRIVFDLMGAPAWWWGMVVLTPASTTAVLGVLSALMQRDLKRLLAYSTIENIGIIFIGLGLALAFKANGMLAAAALAFTAALLHAFNHSLFKSLLFFGAGALQTATHERDIEKLGGLIHAMPQTAFLVLGGCLAISALPPLNGFVSEWLVFQAVLMSPDLPQWGLKLLVPAVGAMLALGAALSAACFVRFYGVAFLGRPRSTAARGATETDIFSRATMAVLLLLCLVVGAGLGLRHRRRGAGNAPAGRADDAGAGRHRVAVDRAGGGQQQHVQRPAVLHLHCRLDADHHRDRASLRLARDSTRPGLGLRLSRSEPGDAVLRRQLRPADPARVRPDGVSRARGGRHAAAGRRQPGAPHRHAARPGVGPALRPARRLGRACHREAQLPAVPHHPPIPEPCVRRPRHPPAGLVDMDMIRDLALQGLQMTIVLALAPLLLGFTRKVKARMLRRRGPPVLQPYRDLLRLIRKEAVLAENASWLFRSGPYMIFAATWVAAALVPTFATGLLFSWTADLIAIAALLGSARFFLALVGMDVGTSFGGIGSSREMMFASLAEPAMIMIAFTLALLAGSTQLSVMAEHFSVHASLRVSLGLALVALIIVAIAENARIPVDNPATHLELTMVHEAMVLEYSGRHLAMIELAAAVKLLLYVSLIGCIFVPWGLAPAGSGAAAFAIGFAAYLAKLFTGGFLLVVFETSIAKMRVFRVPEFLGIALMLGLLGTLLRFMSRSF